LWVGLALAPPLILFLPMVLGLMYVGLALGEFGILFASMSYADAAATWLLFILTYQQFCWRRTHAAEAALVLLTAMTILAGLLGLSRINIDSYGFWILRETLGVALILLWLTNLVRSNIFPVRGAYTSGAILISLSIILGLVFATTGIPNEPSQEVTAACLTLGYVPSLVLPIVVLPSYLRWHHARLLHLRRSGEA
jgi:hypothetical protein